MSPLTPIIVTYGHIGTFQEWSNQLHEALVKAYGKIHRVQFMRHEHDDPLFQVHGKEVLGNLGALSQVYITSPLEVMLLDIADNSLWTTVRQKIHTRQLPTNSWKLLVINLRAHPEDPPPNGVQIIGNTHDTELIIAAATKIHTPA